MRPLFTKPLEMLDASDVLGVKGWPESAQVEFKRDLPSRENRGDNWVRGGKVEQYAKEKMFKELVALANTSGGHVVLRIPETMDKPPQADGVSPIRHCVELAESLERAAQAIDPPIPRLGVRGIPTEPDGSGIVVFRIPESRSAPHRSIDKECYIRQGMESKPMTMREIQDMTIAVGSRSQVLAKRLRRSREELNGWFSQPTNLKPRMSGFRVTAVPVNMGIALPRLYGTLNDLKLKQQFGITASFSQSRSTDIFVAPHLPTNQTPILRGVRMADFEERVCFNVYSDGCVEVVFGTDSIRGRVLLFFAWIAAYVVNVLRAADYLRSKGGLPDAEYALECEIIAHSIVDEVEIGRWGSHSGIDSIGNLKQLPLVLPRLSFGPLKDVDEIVSSLFTDISDATGMRYPELPRIEIDLAEIPA